MAKIELKTEELQELLMRMQGESKPAPAPTVVGQEGPRTGAAENLSTFQSLREARPTQAPTRAGTPTQARIQAEEQARLQREQMAQQMAIARMNAAGRSGSSGGGETAGGVAIPTTKAQAAQWIQEAVNHGAREGRTVTEIIDLLGDSRYQAIWDSGVMGFDEATDLARRYYGPALRDKSFASEHYSPFSYTEGEALRRQGSMSPADLAKGMNIAPPASGAHGATRDDMRQQALQNFSSHVPDTEIAPGIYQGQDGRKYKFDHLGNRIYEGAPGWSDDAGGGGSGADIWK